ncbi:MAG TPA: polysaccharide deacetylase family protein [Desulfobulbaceae bacterium]|nr:polysaccharide deacetylase family protein [Desulfobulbaceae bacterium]
MNRRQRQHSRKPLCECWRKRRYSLAEKCGFCAIALAALLFFIAPALAIVPLAVFIVACLLSPFFSTSSFFLPVVSRGKSGQPWVSLTFDDGPDPVSTPLLLHFLRDHGLVATFFVNGDKARRFPDIIRQIVDDGHTIGNHSTSHDNFLMFRGVGRTLAEIGDTQNILADLGVDTKIFRPPVGIVTPGYAQAMAVMGLALVTFRRRPRDLGNRCINGLAAWILTDIRSDDILLLHDAPPRRATVAAWLAELETLVVGIDKRGFAVVSLDSLLGGEVMVKRDWLRNEV